MGRPKKDLSEVVKDIEKDGFHLRYFDTEHKAQSYSALLRRSTSGYSVGRKKIPPETYAVYCCEDLRVLPEKVRPPKKILEQEECFRWVSRNLINTGISLVPNAYKDDVGRLEEYIRLNHNKKLKVKIRRTGQFMDGSHGYVAEIVKNGDKT